MTGKIIYIFIIALFLLSAAYADITVTAKADRYSLGVSESAFITVTVSGDNNSLPSLQAPQIENGKLYSQGSSTSLSIVNGRVSGTNEYSYIFIPEKPGKAIIPPFFVTVNNQKISSRVLTFDISQAPVKPAQQPQTEETADNTVFLEAYIDKNHAYPNEPLVYSLKIFYNVGLSNSEFVENPSFDGFWAEDIEPSPQQYYETRNGTRYRAQEIYKKILFPMASGEYTIPPVRLRVNVQVRSSKKRPGGFSSLFDDDFDSFFERYKVVPKIISTTPITLTVSDFPKQGKPDDFSGCVGNFSCVASVDKNSLKTNEPVEFTLTISGTGNIKQFKDPDIKFGSDFKIFESKSSTDTSTARGYFEGRKIFKYILVSKTAGQKTIPPISLSYFDSAKQTYRTISTNPVILNITQGSEPELPPVQIHSFGDQAKIMASGHDIRYIKNPPEITDFKNGIHRRISFYILLILFPLSYLILSVYQQYIQKLYSNTGFVRSKNALPDAQKRLAHAEKLMKESSAKDFYNALIKTLHCYLADKLNLPAASFTVSSESERLASVKGMNDILLKNLQNIAQICEFSCFASFSASADDMQKMLARIKSAVKECEKLDFGEHI